jgi:radical SAM superfamily enzyme YgiQ (UPF0313 family)
MNKNIYLINPSEKGILDNCGDRIPHGLISIASYLNTKGYNTKVWDFNHSNRGDFINSFIEDKPFMTGISVYTSPLYEEAVKIAEFLKGHTKLVAGGYHATAMPETLTKSFNAVIKGEGEYGMLEAITKDGIITAEKPDIDILPPEDYSLIDISKYGIGKKRQGTIITSRGCPYSCSFCFNMSKKVRKKPINHVRKELDDLMAGGFRSVYFLDDVFTIDKDRMNRITDYCKVPFRVTTRANLINEEKMRILSKNGCEWLSLGIESGNDGILKQNNKGMTTADNLNAVRLAYEYGIKTKGFFIIGLSGETENTAWDTLNFSMELRENGLTDADFYYLTPFPGTPIWNNAHFYNIDIVSKDFTKYLQAGNGAKCVINTQSLKADKIEELVNLGKRVWRKR